MSTVLPACTLVRAHVCAMAASRRRMGGKSLRVRTRAQTRVHTYKSIEVSNRAACVGGFVCRRRGDGSEARSCSPVARVLYCKVPVMAPPFGFCAVLGCVLAPALAHAATMAGAGQGDEDAVVAALGELSRNVPLRILENQSSIGRLPCAHVGWLLGSTGWLRRSHQSDYQGNRPRPTARHCARVARPTVPPMHCRLRAAKTPGAWHSVVHDKVHNASLLRPRLQPTLSVHAGA